MEKNTDIVAKTMYAVKLFFPGNSTTQSSNKK